MTAKARRLVREGHALGTPIPYPQAVDALAEVDVLARCEHAYARRQTQHSSRAFTTRTK
jgi:hypothetical protein